MQLVPDRAVAVERSPQDQGALGGDYRGVVYPFKVSSAPG